MNKYSISIKAKDGELEEILKELNDAQEKIYRCYTRLQNLGVLIIDKEEAASGN